MAKLTLNIAAMQDDFFSDASLIGIVSAMPAYSFCLMLNQRFDLKFVREYDMDICVKTNKNGDTYEHFYAVYEYCAPLNGARNLLYKLKNEQQVLMPELKNMDYLWMINNACNGYPPSRFAEFLNQMPHVQMVKMLEPDSLKKRAHLLV